MPCYRPISGYRTASGTIAFAQKAYYGECNPITIACGQCIGCRLERSRMWAMRCVHEASLYEQNCFITLTYDDTQIPTGGNLNYRDYQLFMKRLRKHAGKRQIRFYAAGEYGPTTWRPHYHAIIFNWDWEDRKYWRTSGSGEKLYTSETLERLWGKGFTTTANMTFESAAYVARYCMKKRTGQEADTYYKRIDENGNEYDLVPEFAKMSTDGGIGADWWHFYKKGVIQSDSIVINGKESSVPAYYDKLLKRLDDELLRDLKESREYNAYLRREDNTDERLRVKETVAKARLNLLPRTDL